jgi:3-hydroxyanthranilate 3,4-dioxygenase
MEVMLPFNLREWIDAHRESLKPPVCNRELYVGSEFIVMIVGGPNSRKDYHHDVGPELFHQIEGDMLLKTMQDGSPIDITIREGDIFMLPPGVPHSPQRFADTVGLVVERQRKPDELDGFLWYCDECHELLHEEYLHVGDIVADLPPIFDRFWSDKMARTCMRCGAVLNRD